MINETRKNNREKAQAQGQIKKLHVLEDGRPKGREQMAQERAVGGAMP